ncbi:dihydroxyacetone kinase phosphoryl donor subunit DhaM [Schaalia sp. lx-260]|uniref:dihydroxyacetone kinase phosphoryl donor subunit DhaM n=1 Tax=Schaalia sp. lx-260 TaxID=2899082 RepID=UPI001E406934|nr:dihydroxyacetone kinase phosphoryl donor subunit DhaM [Schaalia sp. lx-260]MCD4549298.1 PTS-dependent dihydroxyacetone kinase phosphotransferase subunit DhaM [Schaalia sp. lx-260]
MACVSFVLVSHSMQLAQGLAELAAQMAPNVHILPAGGREDNGLGTSYDRIDMAINTALSHVSEEVDGGVLILTDLGSATMTAESVVEMSDTPEKLVLVDAPLVEGTIAAVVRAQIGDTLDEVVEAARQAASQWKPQTPKYFSNSVSPCINKGMPDETVNTDEPAPITAQAVVADPEGLHARPAALLARLASTFDAETFVDGADASSVLEIMTLGARQGQTVTVKATGIDAEVAVTALVRHIEGHDTDT